MTTTASPKPAESTAVNEAVKARMAPKQAAQVAPVDITANPVAKIVFNPEAAPEERSPALPGPRGGMQGVDQAA
jgi:hypothetical protein